MRLCSDWVAQAWSRGYLSGVLIGSEMSALSPQDTVVTLIGEAALVSLYERALAAMGRAVQRVDAEAAVIAGLELARGAKRKDKP